MAYPVQVVSGLTITHDHIEAQRSPVKFGVALQQTAGRSQDALSLAGIDAGGSSAPLMSLSVAHFHHQHSTCMQCNKIQFAAAGAEVSHQDRRAL